MKQMKMAEKHLSACYKNGQQQLIIWYSLKANFGCAGRVNERGRKEGRKDEVRQQLRQWSRFIVYEKGHHKTKTNGYSQTQALRTLFRQTKETEKSIARMSDEWQGGGRKLDKGKMSQKINRRTTSWFWLSTFAVSSANCKRLWFLSFSIDLHARRKHEMAIHSEQQQSDAGVEINRKCWAKK